MRRQGRRGAKFARACAESSKGAVATLLLCFPTILAVEVGHHDCSIGLVRLWSAAKRDCCCREASKGCPMEDSYNCTAGVSQWSDKQRTWCCRNRRLGCVPFAETGSADLCQSACTVQSMVASCQIQIEWAYRHVFNGSQAACAKAHALVVKDCTACSESCEVQDACGLRAALRSSIADPEGSAGGRRFNCSHDLSDWQRQWSREKQEWCCRHVARGCPNMAADLPVITLPTTTAPPRTTTTTAAHTSSSASSASSAQTTSQKTESGRGVGRPRGSKWHLADCLLDLETWMDDWTVDKVVWCCTRSARHCPRAPLRPQPLTSEHFRGDHPQQNNSRISTTGTSIRTTMTIDSTSNAPRDESSSTSIHRSLGHGVEERGHRPQATTTHQRSSAEGTPGLGRTGARAPREAGFRGMSGDNVPISAGAKATPPPTTTTKPKHDCLMLPWTAEKAMWCCEEHGRGCELTTKLPLSMKSIEPYDCEMRFDEWHASWSIAKQSWCCQYYARGCPSNIQATTVVPELYSCDHGEDWQMTWPMQKARWCCNHYQKGCPPGVKATTTIATTTQTTTTTLVGRVGYDPTEEVTFTCVAGFAHWRQLWPPAQARWCCRNFGRACDDSDGPGFTGIAPLQQKVDQGRMYRSAVAARWVPEQASDGEAKPWPTFGMSVAALTGMFLCAGLAAAFWRPRAKEAQKVHYAPLLMHDE